MEINVKANLPLFLQKDGQAAAIAAGIQAMLDWAWAEIGRGLERLMDTGKMPEEYLDFMARDLGLGWYDFSAGVDVKRRALSGYREIAGSIGTVASIESMARQYFGDGDVVEGTEPFHFSISSANPEAVSENAEKLQAMLEAIKPVRSIYDGAQTESKATLNLFGAMGAAEEHIISMEVQ